MIEELTLFVTSRCNLWCDGCIMQHFMIANKNYTMPLDELAQFIAVTQQSGYVLNLIICGGEPLLWPHLETGLKMIHDAKISNRILLFSNVMDIRGINDSVMNYLTELRISKYQCNTHNTDILQNRYPQKIRIAERTVFYEQPSQPLTNVLPCECVNQEFLYMNHKVYACAHGASRNNGQDTLEDGTKLYVDLAVGYLQKLPEIRQLQEVSLCGKCSSNTKVRSICHKFHKQEQDKFTVL